MGDFMPNWAEEALSSKLRAASYRGDESEVDLLLKSGADPLAAGPNGQCAIHMAAMGGRHEICEKLLVATQGDGVDMQDEHGRTPMHLASRNGMVDCIQTLIMSAANPLYRDSFGQTAKDVAKDQRTRILVDVLEHVARLSGMRQFS